MTSDMKNHPPVINKIGVLLVNLGTPDGTDFFSMWKYLREFLEDRRVIELSRWLWLPILYGIILPIRSLKSGKNYQKIWNIEKNQSPLRIYTKEQTKKLAAAFSENDIIMVDYAMRYGNPSIEKKILHMQEKGCQKILFVPLYPQYSAATTATANDKLFKTLMKMRYMPTIRITPPYYDDTDYINALSLSVQKHLQELHFTPQAIIVSFHGIPKSYFTAGDPYYCLCQKTSRLLREKLQYPKEKFFTCFQSRFGRQEWLQPYIVDIMKKIPQEGITDIAVIAPGFSADCLETIEEINGEVKEMFFHAGGRNFTYIPALNASQESIDMLKKMVTRELMGWI